MGGGRRGVQRKTDAGSLGRAAWVQPLVAAFQNGRDAMAGGGDARPYNRVQPEAVLRRTLWCLVDRYAPGYLLPSPCRTSPVVAAAAGADPLAGGDDGDGCGATVYEQTLNTSYHTHHTIGGGGAAAQNGGVSPASPASSSGGASSGGGGAPTVPPPPQDGGARTVRRTHYRPSTSAHHRAPGGTAASPASGVHAAGGGAATPGGGTATGPSSAAYQRRAQFKAAVAAYQGQSVSARIVPAAVVDDLRAQLETAAPHLIDAGTPPADPLHRYARVTRVHVHGILRAAAADARPLGRYARDANHLHHMLTRQPPPDCSACEPLLPGVSVRQPGRPVDGIPSLYIMFGQGTESEFEAPKRKHTSFFLQRTEHKQKSQSALGQ